LAKNSNKGIKHYQIYAVNKQELQGDLRPNYCRVTVVSTRPSHFRILVVFRTLIPHFTSAN